MSTGEERDLLKPELELQLAARDAAARSQVVAPGEDRGHRRLPALLDDVHRLAGGV